MMKVACRRNIDSETPNCCRPIYMVLCCDASFTYIYICIGIYIYAYWIIYKENTNIKDSCDTTMFYIYICVLFLNNPIRRNLHTLHYIYIYIYVKVISLILIVVSLVCS